MHKKLLSMIMVIGLIFSGIIIVVPENTNAEYSGLSYYWDDEGGSDNLASTATNWYQMNGEVKTDDIVPSEGSHVYINESSSAITWDLTVYIENLTISTGYTGIFTWGAHANINDLYITAGTISGNTYYVDISGNAYINPTTATTHHGKYNITGDGKTLYYKNSRQLELRIYGNITYTGYAYWCNLFTGNGTTIIIPNEARLGFAQTTLTYMALTLQGTITSTGNGNFVQFYTKADYHDWYGFNNPNCDYVLENSGTIAGFSESLKGDIVAKSITIRDSTPGSTLIAYTNGYKLSSQGTGHTWGVRTTVYLNNSVVYCNGNFAVSASTVYYGTSSIILSGTSGYTITPASGASLYNLTINASSYYTMGSSFTVTSWCCILGYLSKSTYTLTAPNYVLNSDLETSMGENEYYNGIVWSNVTMVYDASSSTYNATFITIVQNANYSWSIIGTPGPDASGSYSFNLIFSNAIDVKYVNFTLTVENTVYCYFDSEPETDMTVGEMYNYHPEIVCNGTYTFWINSNGALVVSNATGNVTGSPIAGIYNIELRVTDSTGNVAYQNWTLTVKPFVSEWSNDEIVDIALLAIIMGIITLFNYLGYVKNSFLLQILSFIVFIFVLVPLWPGSEIGGLLILVFGIGNIGLLIGGLMK